MTPKIQTSTSEFDIFSDIPTEMPSTVKDIEGNTISVKKLTLKQEIEFFKVLADFIKQAPDDAATLEEGAAFLCSTPTFYLNAAVPILKLSTEEIQDRFDLDALKGLIDPFFVKYMRRALVENPLLRQDHLMPSRGLSPSLSTTEDGQSTKL